MTRFVNILSLTVLLAVCSAEAATYLDELITPNLETFEAAIKQATGTFVAPHKKLPKGDEWDRWRSAYEYASLVEYLQETDNLGKKIYLLKEKAVDELRVLIVDDVLKNVKAKLRVDDEEEARKTLKAECETLKSEGRPTLEDAANILEDVNKRSEYFETSDDDVLRVVNLATFCDFL